MILFFIQVFLNKQNKWDANAFILAYFIRVMLFMHNESIFNNLCVFLLFLDLYQSNQ